MKINEEIKICLLLILSCILMIITAFSMQYAIDLQENPCTFTVDDKYYLYDPLINGYYIEDLNIPLTHSRRISDYAEWKKMEIGKTYTCNNIKIDIFDMNPHHKSMYCEEVVI